ncbi:MAG: hypothetical protein GX667_02385 [Xanthomonadaceae bacterium]|nr:hypothetical protein [Xanthomonadaceae bacterium]
MQTIPKNQFKLNLHEKTIQIGARLGLADGTTADIAAHSGFDWLLIDAEHGPNDLKAILEQIRIIEGHHNVSSVVRLPAADPITMKRILNIGAQSVMVPMIESKAEAEAMVKAVHYPPKGVRGVAGNISRASRWGDIPNYLLHAEEEIALILQVETVEGLDALDEILSVKGIDGIFIGPADLSASMGYCSHPDHPKVQAAIHDAILKIRKAGLPVGLIHNDPVFIKHYMHIGASFMIVCSDASTLRRAYQEILEEYE